MFWRVCVVFLLVVCVRSEDGNAELLARLERAESMLASLSAELREVHMLSSGNYSMGYINAVNAPYNAVGDGVTDNTNAIQSALNDAAAMGGGVVLLPAGNYYVSQSLSIPADTTLKGVWQAPPMSWGSGSSVHGTTLLAVSTTAPFLYMAGPNAAIEGLSVFYPNQIVSSTPKAYPFTIQGNGFNLAVRNVLLVNSYQGIDFATYQCARHYVDGVYGQPLKIGIQVDQCYDIGRIRHVHFWPFWTQDPSIESFQGANAITFLFYRSDWEVVEDVFSWGYQFGMYFTGSSHGSTNGQFSNIDFDNVDVGIVLNNTQPYGVFFSNLNIANAGNGVQHVGIIGSSGGNAHAVFRGVSFWGSINQCVDWDNQGYIMLTDSFLQPSGGNAPKPAIGLYSGRAMVRGNYFEDGIPSGVAVEIGSNTDRIMVVDNELVGNTIINSGTDTLVTDNHA